MPFIAGILTTIFAATFATAFAFLGLAVTGGETGSTRRAPRTAPAVDSGRSHGVAMARRHCRDTFA